MKDKLKELANVITDRVWRLNNLYWIVDEQGKKVRFKLRPAQLAFTLAFWFFNILLKARQLGFTTLIDLLGLDMCLFTPNFRMVIIADTKEKGVDIFNNKIVFPYNHLPPEIKAYCKVVSLSSSKSGGEIVFSNGSSVAVMVSARSGTVQFLHITEYGKICAQQPAKAKEIQTGSLPTVHDGGFIFIESTAMGRAGHFYDLTMEAEKLQQSKAKLDRRQYKLHFFPWHQNPKYVSNSDIVIPDRLLDYFDMLYHNYGVALSEEQMAWYAITEQVQGENMWSEYPSYPEEAFKSAREGNYYGRPFTRIYQENRITAVPCEEALPVYTFWDLGISDDTAIWFAQFVGKEVRLIDYYEGSGEGLSHYINILRGKPYRYGKHYAPHDIAVRELTTGISRQKTAEELGLRLECVPTNIDLLSGIEEVRLLLPYCWFDEAKCEAGIKCLESYRKAWDEKNGMYKDRPLHDWSSHGADGFRTLAVAKKLGMIPGLDRLESNRITVTGGLSRR